MQHRQQKTRCHFVLSQPFILPDVQELKGSESETREPDSDLAWMSGHVHKGLKHKLNPVCLVGILVMVYYNPYITGWVNPFWVGWLVGWLEVVWRIFCFFPSKKRVGGVGEFWICPW